MPPRTAPMPLTLRLPLVAAKVVLVTLLASLAFGLAPGFDGGAAAERVEQAAVAAQARAMADLPVRRAVARHGCAVTGLDVEPRSALVSRGGRLRLLDVTQAWLVQTGQAPGRLVAVCRAEA